MFTERLNELLSDVCGTTTGEFSKITKYDRSYITHLRNGDRVPKPGRVASRRLSQAIYVCAAEKGVTRKLCERVSASPLQSEDDVCAAVGAWLFAGQPPSAPKQAESAPSAEPWQKGGFGRRLNAAMELADISNLRLARALNVDMSVISKFRSGLRVPRADHPLLREVSAVLAERVCSLERLPELRRLVGAAPDTPDDESAQCLEAWLRDFSATDTSLIESFLDGLDRFSPDTSTPLPDPDKAAGGDILADSADAYDGVDGLRRAVLRFLGCAVRDRRRELLLYSDQNMDWMTGDRAYAARWMSLMSAYIRGGGRIQIIHNVDRGLEEMFAAIRSWLPLYMSGRIESWYCLRRGGDRFFHTLFLSPGEACISGCYVTGREQNARFRYLTAPEELSYAAGFYQDLRADCRPLLQIAPAGINTQFAALRKSGDVHLMSNTLSLATMPETLLRRILERSKLAEETRRAILESRLVCGEVLEERLAQGAFHECVPLPDEALLFAGRVPVDTEYAALHYTPEEYAEHVQSVLSLAGRCPHYRFHPLSEAPFQKIKIAATEHTAMFSYLTKHTATFISTYAPMCRSFVSFALRLEEQYDCDTDVLKEKLKLYL